MTQSAILNLQNSLFAGNTLNTALAIIGTCLLAGLLLAEKQRRTGLILCFKTPLSALFLGAALIQPHLVPSYYQFVLAGLVCGLIGDVCLALKGKKAFRVGLVVFLIGHILYVVAFVGLTRLLDWGTSGHFLIAAVSLGVFLRLRTHLGNMLVPVVLYVVVISIMVAAAWVAFLNPDIPRSGALTLLLGAILFYLSDVLVARERFVESDFVNRLFGLPLYYCGQFLIAFSVGLV
jgi:uncharacterized membrane protein YhhN